MRETLLNNFLRIAKIPRSSGKEEKIAEFFVDIAKSKDLYYYKDENNNVLIKKKGNLNSDPIALQAHLDMVCVKDKGKIHNFDKDGIKVLIDNDKVYADGTSLGADDGIGLMFILTLLEDETLNHPDLEFILTVEEETTFKGATTFPYDKVTSKRVINLDVCEDDEVFVGNTGDILNEFIFNGKKIETNLPAYRLTLENIPGGNSGMNVELSQNNAIQTLVKNLFKENNNFLLGHIAGGTNENDIATNCELVINTDIDLTKFVKENNIKIEKVENKNAFSQSDTEKIFNQIASLKSGFIENACTANLGYIEENNSTIKIQYLIRNIDVDKLNKTNEIIKNNSNDFKISEIYRDDCWLVQNNSPLLKLYKNVYYQKYKTYPKETIIQGGLECALIDKGLEGADIIAIGAKMENFHTTKELIF